MTLIPQNEDIFPAANTLEDLEDMLLELKAEVKALRNRLREGEVAAVKDGTKLLSDIRAWLRIAYELETTFHDRRRKQAAAQRGHAIDFDQARDQIRCRLDRMRRCQHSKGVSG